MGELSKNYGAALYSVAKGAEIADAVYQELCGLDKCFASEPRFLKLLSSVNIPKAERLSIVSDCLSGRVHPYVLSFMKLLTERASAAHFSECFAEYREQYFFDNGITPVTAVTAVPLSALQLERLREKLAKLVGGRVILTNSIDPTCLGGVKLSYRSKQIDGTVKKRLDEIGGLLKADG